MPQTGYSIIQNIADKTQGHWRPGPGTIYPVLKKLSKERLAKRVMSGDRVLYDITQNGRLELDEMRRSLAERGSNEVMVSLISELLPASLVHSVYRKHYGVLFDVFSKKLALANPSEREKALGEMEGILQNQLAWVRSQLRTKCQSVEGLLASQSG